MKHRPVLGLGTMASVRDRCGSGELDRLGVWWCDGGSMRLSIREKWGFSVRQLQSQLGDGWLGEDSEGELDLGSGVSTWRLIARTREAASGREILGTTLA
jgi:hypothetical protein